MEIINRNIKIFLKVVETGSITKAAKELYISQPAVSKAVAKLEEELGSVLFSRDRRNGLQLTETGRSILPTLSKLVETEKELVKLVGTTDKIRVATMPIITSAAISKVLPLFKKQYPEVSVELIEDGAEEINRMVSSGEADIGISIPPFEDLEAELLIKDRMVAIYTGEERTEVDLETSDKPLILCSIGHEVVSKCMEGSFEQQNCIVVRNSETVISLVQNGNGVGVISEYVLSKSDNTLNSCAVMPQISFDYVLVTKSFKKLSQPARELAELIKEQI